MTKDEQDIIDGTKEFAKAHNIHYDQMTENMILNALREQLILFGVGKCTCDIPSNQTHFEDGKVKWTCFKCKKPS